MMDTFYAESNTELAFPRVRGDFRHEAQKSTLTPKVLRKEAVYEQFTKLERKWKRETVHISSLDDRYNHVSYRQIIGLGPNVVPFILESLEREPDYWFYALRQLTGDNPIPATYAGKMSRTAKAWLRWGKDHGYATKKAR